MTNQEPPEILEISAQALGMSWFVFHTELVPRLFDRPWRADEAFLRALAAAPLPPLRAVTSERTTFVLFGKELRRFPELRQLTFDLDPAGLGAREPGEPDPVPTGSRPPR